MKSFKRIVKESGAYILLHLFWLLPIKRRKILFSSFLGSYINDNPKAVYEAIIQKGYNVDMLWVVKDDDIPVGIKAVRMNSLRMIYELATAKVWVDNCRKLPWIRKRRGQFYVQLWHDVIPVKRIENDVEDKLSSRYVSMARNDSKMIDFMVSSSKRQTEVFNTVFWYKGKVLECGSPRTDILISGDYGEIRKKVVRHYGVEENSEFVLYAPTFRNSNDFSVYDVDLDKVISLCREQTGREYTAIVRLHPNISALAANISYSNTILNGTEYPDVNELIIASDIIITDYSSIMFEGILACKKIMLYVKDYECYKEERGLYYTLEELPFPKAYSNDEIENALTYMNSPQYTQNVNEFEKMLGIIRNGSSSLDVADLIIRQIEK